MALRSLVDSSCATCALIALLAPARASAEPSHERARLSYETGPKTETCPSAETVRARVTERLGYDPFDDQAAKAVMVRMQRDQRGYRATVALREASGTVRTREPLVSNATDCAEIASAVTLAISIAVDPFAFVAPPPSSVEPPDATPAPPEPPSPTPPLPPPPSPPSLGWRAGAGLATSVGALPAPSLGAGLVLGVHGSRFGVDVGGRYDFPVSEAGSSKGRVSASSLLVTLASCFEPSPVALCALVTAGGIFGEGAGVAHTRSDATFTSAAGGRFAFDLWPRERWSIRFTLDVEAYLRPTTLRIANADVWSTPAVLGTAGIVVLRGLP